jgi:excisionase family DNA binding protein
MAERDPKDRMLVQLTAGELERLVDERVRAAVRDEVTRLVGPRFLNTAQVAEMLGVSDRYVAELVRDQGLPTARPLGRHARFDHEAVIAWMRERRVDEATVTPIRRVK